MTVLAIALDGAQVDEQGTVEAEQVEGVAGDVAALAIPCGVAGMFQLMTIDGVNGPVSQLRESGEEILTRITAPDIGACDQEGIEFTQQALAPGRMKRVEKGGALEGFAKSLGALLEEIPSADRFAENAQDAEANKIRIADSALGANRSYIAIQKSVGGCEQLIEQQRIGSDIGTRRITIEGRRSHAVRVSKATRDRRRIGWKRRPQQSAQDGLRRSVVTRGAFRELRHQNIRQDALWLSSEAFKKSVRNFCPPKP